VKLGYETSKGHFVRFSSEELDALRPESTRTIDVSDFVDLADIDPIFYNRTYWLAPASDEARGAYALLRDAMDDEEKVGIGSVVMRRRQYLAALRPVRGALALSTMRFADEVIPSSALEGIPKRAAKAKAKEIALARQIIESLASPWKPERYHDTYTEELRRLVTRRSKGAKVEKEEEPTKTAQVVDLMEALEASVKRAKGRRTRKRKSA
jgi:DNA end-binding protein Ku